jgi:hypothetical protein
MLACAALGALALAPAPAIGQAEEHIDGPKQTATLSGNDEVPGPADPHGAGLFEARINTEHGRICYSLSAGNIGKATGATLHLGALGANGDPVLTLERPDGHDEDSEECQDIDRALAAAILRDPAGYYVQVRSDEFPDGAIRGQLNG